MITRGKKYRRDKSPIRKSTKSTIDKRIETLNSQTRKLSNLRKIERWADISLQLANVERFELQILSRFSEFHLNTFQIIDAIASSDLERICAKAFIMATNPSDLTIDKSLIPGFGFRFVVDGTEMHVGELYFRMGTHIGVRNADITSFCEDIRVWMFVLQYVKIIENLDPCIASFNIWIPSALNAYFHKAAPIIEKQTRFDVEYRLEDKKEQQVKYRILRLLQ